MSQIQGHAAIGVIQALNGVQSVPVIFDLDVFHIDHDAKLKPPVCGFGQKIGETLLFGVIAAVFFIVQVQPVYAEGGAGLQRSLQNLPVEGIPAAQVQTVPGMGGIVQGIALQDSPHIIGHRLL